MLCQVRTLRINDHTTGVTTQSPFDDGHSHPVEQRLVGKPLIHLEEQMVAQTQEFRYSVLVNQFLHTQSQFLGVTHLTGLVKHTHHEFLVIGRSHHRTIHVLLVLLGLGQSRVTLILELSHP